MTIESASKRQLAAPCRPVVAHSQQRLRKCVLSDLFSKRAKIGKEQLTIILMLLKLYKDHFGSFLGHVSIVLRSF